MNIIPLQNWFAEFEEGPLFIAGPCSAESEDQVMQTALSFDKDCKPSIFRAGIWKPRTRPGSFSGVGSKGLRWLGRVKKETGMRVAVEVASPRHLEMCLKNGIDIIWIGARTVSNPFSVQEIAEALKGVDIPVFIKNPLNPDIDLWIGAVERVNNAGISRLAAVHRGFSPFEQTRYRNMPKWEVPIELRRRIRDIPVFCDPSHISGDSDLVPELAQKAMDLNMDGLMTEVHINPSDALSDSNQQLSPDQYCILHKNLVIRRSKPEDPGFINYLEEFRNQVDSIDHQIIELLAKRLETVERIGAYKFSNNVAVLQMERWLEILKTRTELAEKSGVDRLFMEKYLKLLHQESIRLQTQVMQKLKSEKNGSGDNGPENRDYNIENDNKG